MGVSWLILQIYWKVNVVQETAVCVICSAIWCKKIRFMLSFRNLTQRHVGVLEGKLREDDLKNSKSIWKDNGGAATKSNEVANFAISQIILIIYRWRVCKGKCIVGCTNTLSRIFKNKQIKREFCRLYRTQKPVITEQLHSGHPSCKEDK